MIFHWCSNAEWEAADRESAPTSLTTDGFVHCSFRDQIEQTAAATAHGRTDLVMLCIDEASLPIRVEDCYQSGERYPHVYGAIPVESVVTVRPFPPSADGSFALPPELPR